MKAFEAGYKGLISGLFFVVALVLLLLSGSSIPARPHDPPHRKRRGAGAVRLSGK